MDSQLLFVCSLATQIYLLSWYLPKRIQARMRYVFDNYPYEQYPKLYAGNLEQSQKNYRRHVVINHITFAIGIGLVIAVIYYGNDLSSGKSSMLAFIYGMIQAIPLILMDILMLKHCKDLNAEYASPQRSASLAPRSIFNHTSMAMLLVVFSFYVMAVLFDMYTKSFDTSLGIDLYESFMILTATNLFFAWMIRWRVYGKKLNPLLAPEDNKKEIDGVVYSALFTSIAVSIFFMTMRAINVYDLEQFEGVLMSIYLQCIFLFSIVHSLNQFPVQDMNMENFRATKS